TILQLGQPNKLGDHKLNQNTMRNYFLPIFFLAATTALSAQSYVTAGGIRLGTEWGLTFKQRVLEHTTVEGILQQSFQRKEFTVTGLAAQHYPVLLNGLNFYFGGGLHKGWNNQPKTFENPDGFKDPFGITAIGGLELTLGRLNLSYDYKPALNLVGGERTFYMQTGLSARYVFYSNRDLKKKERAKKKQTRKEKIRKKLRFWEKD
ncbi:MAG: hypothetical protein K9J45_18485, partial [Bacteroidales bacterium]|nr:hypothetical protein [Bacteroidales bacterium]